MKKILVLLALLPTLACAQTAPQDSTLDFRCNLYDAQFVAGTMPQSPIIDAIAWACEGITDSAAEVTVVVSQGDLISVALNNRFLAEGIAAEVNARLLMRVYPLTGTRPWLKMQMLAIQSDNRKLASIRAKLGADLIKAKIIASNRQH